MTNQELLNLVEALLRQVKEKPCSQCQGIGSYQMFGRIEAGFTRRCSPCGGTGTITDPSLQAAWDVVTYRWAYVNREPTEHQPIPVESSRGNWPDGAIRGLLEQVMETICGIRRFRWPSDDMNQLAEVIAEEIKAHGGTR